MRKLVSNSNVALSFGSRGWKRITPSSLSTQPREDHEPEHQERVREDRAEDRRAGDHDLAR